MEKIKSWLNKIVETWKESFNWQKIVFLGAVGLLLAAGIVWMVDPYKQFAKMRNAQRREDVSLILNAIYQYTVDNQGKLPGEIGTEPREICKLEGGCQNMINLSEIVQKKKNTAYLSSMPIDPDVKEGDGTGYAVKKNGDRISVMSLKAEQGAIITSTR